MAKVVFALGVLLDIFPLEVGATATEVCQLRLYLEQDVLLTDFLLYALSARDPWLQCCTVSECVRNEGECGANAEVPKA